MNTLLIDLKNLPLTQEYQSSCPIYAIFTNKEASPILCNGMPSISFQRISNVIVVCRRAVGTTRQGGSPPSQILADQLILSQPGWQIIPTPLLLATPPPHPQYSNFPTARLLVCRRHRLRATRCTLINCLANVTKAEIGDKSRHIENHSASQICFGRLGHNKLGSKSIKTNDSAKL